MIMVMGAGIMMTGVMGAGITMTGVDTMTMIMGVTTTTAGNQQVRKVHPNP
jgi:hypothetical protein